MLFLTRKVGQAIVVGDYARFRLLGADGQRVQLAIELQSGGVLLCRGFNAGGDFCLRMEQGDRFEFGHRSLLHIRNIGYSRAILAFRVPDAVKVLREELLPVGVQNR